MCVVSISPKARIHGRIWPTTPERWTTWHGCDLQATKFYEISYLRNPNCSGFLQDSRSVHLIVTEYAKKFENIPIFYGDSGVFNSVSVTRFISKLLQLFWLVTLIRRGCLFFRQECVSSLVQHQDRCLISFMLFIFQLVIYFLGSSIVHFDRWLFQDPRDESEIEFFAGFQDLCVLLEIVWFFMEVL